MRFRKNASKLLGSAIVYSSAPFSLVSDTWAPPFSANASVCASSREVCELNQSPWDVYPNLHFFTSSFKDGETPCLKEAQEEVSNAISENQQGISGKSAEKEITEAEPARLCKRVVMKKNKVKKSTTKKSKVKKTTTKKSKVKKTTTKKNSEPTTPLQTNETTPVLCKKNDGKKWFCKRPAQLPHSFCDYHLEQSRSYYSSHKEKETSELESWCKTTKKKETGGANSSPYYYYNGFRPYSRKRRGARNSESDDNTMPVDEKKADVFDVPVVHDAAEDHAVDDKAISGSNVEEKKVCKKRRRKTKCRSLKSLM